MGSERAVSAAWVYPSAWGEPTVMASRPRPPGYHCSKALRRLGLEAEAISSSLRRRLGLDTDEIAEVLAYPITPPDGVVLAAAEPSFATVDLTDLVDAREPQEERRQARSTVSKSDHNDPSS